MENRRARRRFGNGGGRWDVLMKDGLRNHLHRGFEPADRPIHGPPGQGGLQLAQNRKKREDQHAAGQGDLWIEFLQLWFARLGIGARLRALL